MTMVKEHTTLRIVRNAATEHARILKISTIAQLIVNKLHRLTASIRHIEYVI